MGDCEYSKFVPIIDQSTQTPLLNKAEQLGLIVPEDLEALAVLRGCRYYDVRNEREKLRNQSRLNVSPADYSNAELAVALLSPALPESLLRQRMGAAMLSARDVDPQELAELAESEGCAGLVRYIAECGQDVEPDEDFWELLLAKIRSHPYGDTTQPHPTRLFEMTGISRGHIGIQKRWLRPVA